jgi:malate synthase
MITYFERRRSSLPIRILSFFLIFTFSFTLIIPPQSATAQTVLNLPVPGAMVPMSPGFTPVLIKGIKIHPDNPLQFDFIVDRGDSDLQGEALETESKRLVKYFLASLTTPEKDMWVNLSPYEEGRIVPESFGITEMGRDLLAQDYLLKQLTASLIYPEDELGKKFWQRVRNKAKALYGTTDIPMNTFNKVWIVPEKATVYENNGTAFVVESHLKVLMEEDYLALKANMSSVEKGTAHLQDKQVKEISSLTSDVVREVIIPEIEKEVNTGENFATLRQIYHSLILAAWFKGALKESLLGQVYVDRNKVTGVDVADKNIKEKIYQQYLAAYKKGVYNYIREDEEYFANTKRVVPKKYFSGGAELILTAPPAPGMEVPLKVANDAGIIPPAALQARPGRQLLMGVNIAETEDEAAQLLASLPPAVNDNDVEELADVAMAAKAPASEPRHVVDAHGHTLESPALSSAQGEGLASGDIGDDTHTDSSGAVYDVPQSEDEALVSFREDARLPGGNIGSAYADILNARTLEILDQLAPLSEKLAELRRKREASYVYRQENGIDLNFLPETNEDGSDVLIPGTNITVKDARAGNFEGSDVPADLQRQWIQLTGPAAKSPQDKVKKDGTPLSWEEAKRADLRNVVHALLSGADGMMFDGEDALGQLETMSLDNVRALVTAYQKDPIFWEVAQEVVQEYIDKGKKPADWNWRKLIEENFTTRIYRVRGVHLDDRQLRFTKSDGTQAAISATIVDMVAYLVNAGPVLIEQGSTPTLYLPKLQTAEEAAFMAQIIDGIEDQMGWERGTVKVFVLIEQLEETFQLMEIRAALGKHFVGFNTGRWDYIADVVKQKMWDNGWVPPNFKEMTMVYPFMWNYEGRVVRAVNTPDRNGNTVLWIGGMEPQIPVVKGTISPEDREAAIENAMQIAEAAKLRELKRGASGTWVAHPGMVERLRQVYERNLFEATGRVNQLDLTENIDGETIDRLNYTPEAAAALTELKPGERTVAEARFLISVAIQYVNAYLTGRAAAALKGADFFDDPLKLFIMEDMATGEGRTKLTLKWMTANAAISSVTDEDRQLLGIDEGATFAPEVIRVILEQEIAKLQTAPDNIVFASSKTQELPIAKMVVEKFLFNDSPIPLPWLIDLANAALGETDLVKATTNVDRYIETYIESDGLVRLTENPEFTDAALISEDSAPWVNNRLPVNEVLPSRALAEIEAIKEKMFWDPETRTGNMRFMYTQRDWDAVDIWRNMGSRLRNVDEANKYARKLWFMMYQFERNAAENNGGPISLTTGGATTGPQAVRMVQAGLRAIYGSGWQGSNQFLQPDRAGYPVTTMPDLVNEINDALERADRDLKGRFSELIESVGRTTRAVYKEDWESKNTSEKAELIESYVDSLQTMVEKQMRIFRQGKERTDTFRSIFETLVTEIAGLGGGANAETQQRTIDWLDLTLSKYAIDFIVPNFSDGDTTHGKTEELMEKFIIARSALIHIEDQEVETDGEPCKKCGHMLGKVAVPLKEQIHRLKMARWFADINGSEMLITARTDTEATKLLSSLRDVRDEAFVRGASAENGIIQMQALIDISREDVPHYKNREEALRKEIERAQWGTKAERREIAKKVREIWAYRDEVRDRKVNRTDEIAAATAELAVLWNRAAILKTIIEVISDAIVDGKGRYNGRGKYRGRELSSLTETERKELQQRWLRLTDPLRIITRDGREAQNINSIRQLKELAKQQFGIEVLSIEERMRDEAAGKQLANNQLLWDFEAAKTFEGFYQIKPGKEMAAFRTREVAPYADFGWVETSRPNIEADRFIAEKIKEFGPSRHLFMAINLSPSFDWSDIRHWRYYLDQVDPQIVPRLQNAIKNKINGFNLADPETWGEFAGDVEVLNQATIQYSEDLSRAGYRFKFITIFSDHVTLLAIHKAASGIANESLGVAHWVFNTQRPGIARGARTTYQFARDHQGEAGSVRVGRSGKPVKKGADATGIGKHDYSALYPDEHAGPGTPGIEIQIDRATGVITIVNDPLAEPQFNTRSPEEVIADVAMVTTSEDLDAIETKLSQSPDLRGLVGILSDLYPSLTGTRVRLGGLPARRATFEDDREELDRIAGDERELSSIQERLLQLVFMTIDQLKAIPGAEKRVFLNLDEGSLERMSERFAAIDPEDSDGRQQLERDFWILRAGRNEVNRELTDLGGTYDGVHTGFDVLASVAPGQLASLERRQRRIDELIARVAALLNGGADAAMVVQLGRGEDITLNTAQFPLRKKGSLIVRKDGEEIRYELGRIALKHANMTISDGELHRSRSNSHYIEVRKIGDGTSKEKPVVLFSPYEYRPGRGDVYDFDHFRIVETKRWEAEDTGTRRQLAIVNVDADSIEIQIPAQTDAALVAEWTPVEVPQDFVPALGQFGLSVGGVEVAALKPQGGATAQDALQDEDTKEAVAISVNQALGSILFSGKGSEAKTVADANAVRMGHNQLIDVVERNPRIAFVSIASEGIRDDSVGTPLGRIYWSGYDGNYRNSSDKNDYEAQISMLRERGIQVVYFLDDGLENTNALKAGERDAWSVTAFHFDRGRGSMRHMLNEKHLRRLSVMANARRDAGITELDSPRQVLEKLARANGIENLNSEEGRAFAGRIVMAVLGRRKAGDEKESGNQRHSFYIDEMHQLEEEYGVRLMIFGDGDLMPGLLAATGVPLDSKGSIVVKFGRSGLVEGEIMELTASEIDGVPMIEGVQLASRVVSNETTKDGVNPETAVQVEDGLLERSVDEFAYSEETFTSDRRQGSSGLEGKAVIAMTAVTGADPIRYGTEFAEQLQGIIFDEVAGTVTASTFVVTPKGVFAVRTTMQSEDLEATRQTILSASPEARAYAADNAMVSYVDPRIDEALQSKLRGIAGKVLTRNRFYLAADGSRDTGRGFVAKAMGYEDIKGGKKAHEQLVELVESNTDEANERVGEVLGFSAQEVVAKFGADSNAKLLALTQEFRKMTYTTPALPNTVGAVIMYDEAANYVDDEGLPLVATHVLGRGVAINHKTDRGLRKDEDSPRSDVEMLPKEAGLGTENLTGIMNVFPDSEVDKFRVTFQIDNTSDVTTPTDGNIERVTEALAQHTLDVQLLGRVATPEPEILIKGTYSIEEAQEVARRVYTVLIAKMREKGVYFPGVILKLSMIIGTKDSKLNVTPEKVGAMTVETFMDVIPADIGGIVFLSGGQTHDQATRNLNEIAKQAKALDAPWQLGASFSRGAKELALKAWQAKRANFTEAQRQMDYTLYRIQAAQLGVLEAFDDMIDAQGRDWLLERAEAYSYLINTYAGDADLVDRISEFKEGAADNAMVSYVDPRIDEALQSKLRGIAGKVLTRNRFYLAADGSRDTGRGFVAKAMGYEDIKGGKKAHEQLVELVESNTDEANERVGEVLGFSAQEVVAKFGADSNAKLLALTQEFRKMTYTTPALPNTVGAVIMYDEAANYVDDEGLPLVATHVLGRGVAINHKTDRGLRKDEDSPRSDVEMLPKEAGLGTENLTGIMNVFPDSEVDKFRVTFQIDNTSDVTTPTDGNIERVTEALAQHTLDVQLLGRVATPEPEILIKGTYSIEEAQEVARRVYTVLIAKMREKGVYFPGVILKLSMIIGTKDSKLNVTPEKVGAMTVETFMDVIPADIGGIVFLSGGQTHDQATRNLNEIAKQAKALDAPWQLGASFSRGAKELALKAWQAKRANFTEAQRQMDYTLYRIQAAQLGVLEAFDDMIDAQGRDWLLERAEAYSYLIDRYSGARNLAEQIGEFVASSKDSAMVSAVMAPAVAQAQRQFMETGALETVTEGPVGGIAFDTLDLNIKRDGNGVALPVNLQDVEQIQKQIEGFYPVILYMAPANLPIFLGLNTEGGEGPTEVGHGFGPQPALESSRNDRLGVPPRQRALYSQAVN